MESSREGQQGVTHKDAHVHRVQSSPSSPGCFGVLNWELGRTESPHEVTSMTRSSSWQSHRSKFASPPTTAEHAAAHAACETEWVPLSVRQAKTREKAALAAAVAARACAPAPDASAPLSVRLGLRAAPPGPAAGNDATPPRYGALAERCGSIAALASSGGECEWVPQSVRQARARAQEAAVTADKTSSSDGSNLSGRGCAVEGASSAVPEPASDMSWVPLSERQILVRDKAAAATPADDAGSAQAMDTSNKRWSFLHDDEAERSAAPTVPKLPQSRAPAEPKQPDDPAPGWVPLSVRQAQRREEVEQVLRNKKLAGIVAPLVVDADTGLPTIPDGCLPIKHWKRWRDANDEHRQAAEKRRTAARIQANRIMKTLRDAHQELDLDSYCRECNLLTGGSVTLSSESSASRSSNAAGATAIPWARGEEMDTCAPVTAPSRLHDPSAADVPWRKDLPSMNTLAQSDDDTDDEPVVMLKRCNSFELFSKIEERLSKTHVPHKEDDDHAEIHFA